MPVTLTSTGITFSDGNSQNTVAAGGASSMAVTRLNASGNYSVPGDTIGVLVSLGQGGRGQTRGPQDAQAGNPGGHSVGIVPTGVASGTVPVTIGARGNRRFSTPFLGNAGGATSYGNFVTSTSAMLNNNYALTLDENTGGGLGAPGAPNDQGQPGFAILTRIG